MGSYRSYRCQPTPQSQQRQIQATSVTYTTAHGNAGSLTHGARPGIEPATSWFLVGSVSTEPRRELPERLISNGTLSLETLHLTSSDAHGVSAEACSSGPDAAEMQEPTSCGISRGEAEQWPGGLLSLLFPCPYGPLGTSGHLRGPLLSQEQG